MIDVSLLPPVCDMCGDTGGLNYALVETIGADDGRRSSTVRRCLPCCTVSAHTDLIDYWTPEEWAQE